MSKWALPHQGAGRIRRCAGCALLWLCRMTLDATLIIERWAAAGLTLGYRWRDDL